MKVCDLNTGVGDLTRAAKRLRECWSETSEYWNDATSQQFEKEHLQQMGPEIQQAMAAIQRFAEIVNQAEKDCEDLARFE